MQKFSKRKNAIIGVAIAAVITAFAVIVLVGRPFVEQQVPASEGVAEEVVAEEYVEFIAPELHFKMLFPKEWGLSYNALSPGALLGPNPGSEDPFWRDVVGSMIDYGSEAWFEVRVKESDVSFIEWIERQHGGNGKVIKGVGYDLWTFIQPVRYNAKVNEYSWGGHATIYSHGTYFEFVLDTTPRVKDEVVMRRVREQWIDVLETFEYVE